MAVRKKKSKASKKTLREIACRKRTPEAEAYYKEYNKLYQREYRKRMKKAAKKAKK